MRIRFLAAVLAVLALACATGPMYLIYDYENDGGVNGGPPAGGVTMEAQTFHGTHN